MGEPLLHSTPIPQLIWSVASTGKLGKIEMRERCSLDEEETMAGQTKK